MYKLDAASLTAKAERLPEAVQSQFLWLGAYCRTECQGDVKILHERFKKLDVDHNITSWQKILRGQFYHDASGLRQKHPAISEINFKEAVRTLQENAHRFSGEGTIGFVLTPSAQTMVDYVDLKAAPYRINRCGMIIGETGNSKSATMNYYKCQHPSHVLLTEAPYRPSSNLLAEALADCLGYGDQNSKRRKERYLQDNLTSEHRVIIENIQRIYDPSLEENQQSFSLLQRLQEQTHCCLIFTLTPLAEKKMLRGAQKEFFEQFIGRCGGVRGLLRLPAYPSEEDVLAIARAYAMKDADKSLTYLSKFAREQGRIRPLFEYFQNAKLLADDQKQPLTIKHLQAVRGDDVVLEEVEAAK